jgi:hypothetical protein
MALRTKRDPWHGRGEGVDTMIDDCRWKMMWRDLRSVGIGRYDRGREPGYKKYGLELEDADLGKNGPH